MTASVQLQKKKKKVVILKVLGANKNCNFFCLLPLRLASHPEDGNN
jgi:hypothetical protein